MPRAKRKVAEETEEVEETKSAPRRGRRKAKVAEEKPKAPAARRGRRKAKAVEEEVEETKPARGRGRGRRKAKEEPEEQKAPAAPRETLYVELYKAVWSSLEDGKDSVVALSDELNPRGKNQSAVAEFMESRGKRKTKAQDVIDFLEEEGVSAAQCDGITSHLINIGLLEIV